MQKNMSAMEKVKVQILIVRVTARNLSVMNAENVILKTRKAFVLPAASAMSVLHRPEITAASAKRIRVMHRFAETIR